jgi:Arc/MetJ-type ribon-helix-helix transcriptional regulator
MSETEKITINLGVVDLGKIDLLVEQGFYSNRTDFIRAAIRNHLDKHDTALQESISRKNFVVGVLIYDANDLNKKRMKNEVFDIYIIGMLSLAKDITPELALSTINSIKVMGIFNAPENVKEALKDRIL